MQTLTIALPGRKEKLPSTKEFRSQQNRNILKQIISYIFCSTFLLAAFFAVGDSSLLLDTDISPELSKRAMVVARYKENPNWLKKVPWNYIVYNKGEALPKWVKNEVKLQNIGHEAHTYLTYIIDNYDNLPNHTIFVQGNPFDHSQELISKINNFDGKTDFFPLSDDVHIENYKSYKEMGPELARSVQKLFLDKIKSFKYFEVPGGAQFIVSKKVILFHTKMTYQKIRDFMMETDNTIDNKAIGYRVFSTKLPEGGIKLFNPKTAFQEITDSMRDENYIIDRKNRIFSANVMEVLWKTLFDSKHKTVYDV